MDAFDRHIGKNGQDLGAFQLVWLFRLYSLMKSQACVTSLSHKLLMKLQRQVLSMYSWQGRSQQTLSER